jgi:hypothetical protein
VQVRGAVAGICRGLYLAHIMQPCAPGGTPIAGRGQNP